MLHYKGFQKYGRYVPRSILLVRLTHGRDPLRDVTVDIHLIKKTRSIIEDPYVIEVKCVRFWLHTSSISWPGPGMTIINNGFQTQCGLGTTYGSETRRDPEHNCPSTFEETTSNLKLPQGLCTHVRKYMYTSMVRVVGHSRNWTGQRLRNTGMGWLKEQYIWHVSDDVESKGDK